MCIPISVALQSERDAALAANVMTRPIISLLDQDTMTDDEGRQILGIIRCFSVN